MSEPHQRATSRDARRGQAPDPARMGRPPRRRPVSLRPAPRCATPNSPRTSSRRACSPPSTPATRSHGRSSERTWLIGILKRKVIDYVRRTTREPTHEGEQDDHYEKKAFDAKGFWALTPRPVGRRSGFRHGERRILDCFFGRAWRICPPRLAEAFLLREMDQMESEDVCQVLGLTAS